MIALFPRLGRGFFSQICLLCADDLFNSGPTNKKRDFDLNDKFVHFSLKIKKMPAMFLDTFFSAKIYSFHKSLRIFFNLNGIYFN